MRAEMDPSKNLSEQLTIAVRIAEGEQSESDVDRLAELVLELDAWLRAGGFAPAQWRPQEDRKLSNTIRAAIENDKRRDKPGMVSVEHFRFRKLIERLVTL